MFLTLGSKIEIGKARFSSVHNVLIKKSIHSLIDTCVIQLPLSAVLKNSETYSLVQVADYIKKEDVVKVALGYKEMGLNIEFEGVVTKINKLQLLEIECEDALYFLRKKQIKKSYKSIGLKSLLQDIITGTGMTLDAQCVDITLSNIQYNNVNALVVLQQIKNNYGLNIHLNKGKLYVGIAYCIMGKEVKYDVRKNIVKVDDLKYATTDELKTSVKAINFKKDGKKEEYVFGDAIKGDDKESKTLYFYGVTDKKELEIKAMAQIEKIKYSGYRGKFETFLIPLVEPNDVANIKDSQYADRSGTYFVSGVEITYGLNGGRRKIEIDYKL